MFIGLYDIPINKKKYNKVHNINKSTKILDRLYYLEELYISYLNNNSNNINNNNFAKKQLSKYNTDIIYFRELLINYQCRQNILD